jgi:hypothetical protein
MMTFDNDDIVFDAATGRQIGGRSKIVELYPRRKKPAPIAADEVDRLTIRADLGGMTVDEVCDHAAQAEREALADRFAGDEPVEPGDDI